MTKTLREDFSKYGISFLAISGLILLICAPFLTPVKAQAAEVIQTWWPTHNVSVSGVQPFKALVPGMDVSQYEMFWQVDGGSWNWMNSDYRDYPHKEASVNLSGWTWHGSGPYVVNFIARKNGAVVAQHPVTIYIDNGLPRWSPQTTPSVTSAIVPTTYTPPTTTTAKTTSVQPVEPTTTVETAVVQTTYAPPTTTTVETVSVQAVEEPTTATLAAAPVKTTSKSKTATSSTLTSLTDTIAPLTTSMGNPLSDFRFYVNPNSPAAAQAEVWKYSNPTWSSMMRMLAVQPTASWLGNWNVNLTQDVRNLVASAQAAGQAPVLVAYAIPQRDCGGYSSGGSNNPSAYESWINALAAGIGSGKAVVILEPDALSQITCLSSSDQSTRLSLLGNAVTTLKKNPGTKVYIDAGHSNWIDPSVMADRLNKSNISTADGFALNVSNFMSAANETTYGTAVSGKVQNKHFVVDTSRNGNGSDGSWCNPLGRAIGNKPTVTTNNALIDAFLWIKVPGESDGPCNGGPSAGVWWPSYALGLVQSSSYVTAL